MQFQLLPNSVAFSIPVQEAAASPAKVTVIRKRLEKRLHPAGPEGHNIERVESRVDKARVLRETRI